MKAICLKCKAELPVILKKDNGKYSCECGINIPYSHGIYQFIEQDHFYEGKFTVTKQQRRVFEKIIVFFIRWISIDGNEERMWQRSTKYIRRSTKGKRLEILNIGAGGGHDFLNKLGTVTAIDLSMKSLLNAQKIYDFCYQADARQIPFPDESFDLVYSSHLLGHVPLEDKQKVIKEIFRVTKIEGFSLHSSECKADNFFYRKAEKYPDLYKKYFQDMYGHYGLEYPSLCKKRFRDETFEPIYEMSDYCKGIVRPAGSYKVFFGAKEFREKNWIFNLLATISEILSFNMLLNLISGIILYPFTILNHLCGPDGVDSVKLLYQKRANPYTRIIHKA